jgi:hypothetical protein
MNVHGTEQEDLSWRAGRQGLRYWVSTADGVDLILAESYILTKIRLQVRIRLRRAGLRDSRDWHQQGSDKKEASEHTDFAPGTFQPWCGVVIDAH